MEKAKHERENSQKKSWVDFESGKVCEAQEPGTMHRTVKYLMMKCLTVHFIAQP